MIIFYLKDEGASKWFQMVMLAPFSRRGQMDYNMAVPKEAIHGME